MQRRAIGGDAAIGIVASSGCGELDADMPLLSGLLSSYDGPKPTRGRDEQALKGQGQIYQ